MPPQPPNTEEEEPSVHGPPPGVHNKNHTVRPTVFQYSCRGYLHLKHQNNAKSNKPIRRSIEGSNQLPVENLPLCRGIQSKLRKVQDMPQSTRDEAILDFIESVSVEPAHSDDKYGGSSDNTIGGRDAKKNNPIAEGRIVGSPPLGPAPALPVLPGSADYGPPPDDLADSVENAGSRKGRRMLSGSVQILPPPESEKHDEESDFDNADRKDGVSTSHYSTLSCWGTTNVSVLMLSTQNGSKEKEVAALAPENTLGMTLRDEGDSKGGNATATIRVGPVEVAIANKYQYEDKALDGKDLNTNGNISPRDEEKREEISNATDNASHKRANLRRGRQYRDDDKDISEKSEPFSDRLTRTVTRTAAEMGNNAKTVINIEFPTRMYKSGERIAGEFGNTLQRAGKAVKNMFDIFSGDDDDDGGER